MVFDKMAAIGLDLKRLGFQRTDPIQKMDNLGSGTSMTLGPQCPDLNVRITDPHCMYGVRISPVPTKSYSTPNI